MLDYSELSQEIDNYFGNNLLFGIVYGKSAYKNSLKYKGDLDSLFIVKQEPSQKDIAYATDTVFKFSENNKLAIDEEVSYDNKLIISEKRLKEIFTLRAFQKNNKVHYVKIIGDEDTKYLNSHLFLDRLFLNALTTKNLFIIGNKKVYEYYVSEAFRSLIALWKNSNSAKGIMDFLMPPKKVWYKDYLGYSNTKIIKKHLLSNLNKYL